MADLYSTIFSRNIGILTESEQAKLRRTTIAVSGVGGVGSMVAERLIRLGVGKLRMTDPQTIEESNLNRQFAASMRNIGQSKAKVVFEHIKDINPEAEITYSDTGIRSEPDAENFVEGCDLVVDEMDVGVFRESLLLQRAARRRGLYYTISTALGFGAIAITFAPDGQTLEEYDQLPADVNPDDVTRQSVPLDRILPIIPSYVSEQYAIDSLETLLADDAPATTVSVGAALAALITTNEVINIILGKKEITVAPKYIYVDLLDQKFIVGTMP
jgi:molybdopterin/thiamine biosynthesis adenylyltransferase